MKLLLSMGMKAHGDPAAPLRPRLRLLDTQTGRVRDVLRLEPPEALHPSQDAHAELTGASRHGDLLLQCTRTEVLELSLSRAALTARWSHPLLHDVHHAIRLPDGTTAVASTGNDLVLTFDASRRLVGRAWLGSGSFEERFRGVQDFRTVPFARFKPHQVHPNHLVWHRGVVWATSLQRQEVRAVGAARPPVRFPEGPPHDGRPLKGAWWFTTVTGHVVAVDLDSGERVRHLDVSAVEPEPGLRGWCRSLEICEDRLFVGMTMLRASRYREVLRRVVRGTSGRKLPTRVLELDLRDGSLVAAHTVGNHAGGTLYAIHALSEDEAALWELRAEEGRLEPILGQEPQPPTAAPLPGRMASASRRRT